MFWRKASRSWNRRRRKGKRRRIQPPLRQQRLVRVPNGVNEYLVQSVAIFFKCLAFPQGTQADSKNAKKKNNKKTNKNKSSVSRANKKKPGMPNVANDLSQKLYATMEKHKEVGLDSLSQFVFT